VKACGRGFQWLDLVWLFGGVVFLCLTSCPAPGQDGLNCRQVTLAGEVSAGKGWHAAIGEGWIFGLVPIESGAKAGEGHYTGWDLVMDREPGKAPAAGYPDALLLATPPYGSLNEREIGTTYGLRAQDAIAWGPRRFHFFSSGKDLVRGRELFTQLMTGNAKVQSAAADALLRMVSDPARTGAGEFAVVDAKLVPGSADPPAFARQWAARLPMVPHTNLQAEGGGTARGELRWIKFSVALWLPLGFHLTPGMHSESVKCAK